MLVITSFLVNFLLTDNRIRNLFLLWGVTTNEIKCRDKMWVHIESFVVLKHPQ